QHLHPFAAGVLQEAEGDADVELVGPLDRYTTVRAGQVALVGAGERQVVGPEGPGAAANGPSLTAATGASRRRGRSHEKSSIKARFSGRVRRASAGDQAGSRKQAEDATRTV